MIEILEILNETPGDRVAGYGIIFLGALYIIAQAIVFLAEIIASTLNKK